MQAKFTVDHPTAKRLDIGLYGPGRDDPNQVYWAPTGNSYVIARHERGPFKHNGVRCALYNINGIGEVRWSVSPPDVAAGRRSPDTSWGEMAAAADYFELTSA